MLLNYISIIAATGFQQHIHEPTHHHGHTLDILVSRDDSSIVNTAAVVDIGLSDNDGNIVRDHYAIRISINRSVKQPHYETISFRNYKHIDEETLKKAIKNLDQRNYKNGTIDEQATNYERAISNLIEIHAPPIRRTVIPRPHDVWYTEELREAKRLRRKLERIWRNGNQESDRQNYRQQCSIVATVLHQTKSSYYSSKVEHCKKDNKALFKITILY